jgi:hypothetical protein
VERYRHHSIRITEKFRAGCVHHGGQRLGQSAPPFIFERMENPA